MKYNNKKTEYKNEIYDSKLEARYAKYLDLLKASGQIKTWERQVKFDLVVNDVKVTSYRADFVVTDNGNHQEIHECKGIETGVWRIKRKLFMSLYPTFNIRIITKDNI